MFNDKFYDEEVSNPIARCAECGSLIYENSQSIYADSKDNYFCSLDCAMEFHGIFQSEECFARED